MPLKVYRRQCGPRAGNFGDELNKLIVQAVFGETVETVSEFADADLVAVGSIVQDIPVDYPGFIWGTGLMFSHLQPLLAKARIISLRGPLTARRISSDVKVFGDPGILVDRLITPEPKRYNIGILPHYVDYDVGAVHDLAKRDERIKVIDPCQHPIVVLREISACECVISSSLHGMIAAHSFGIPATWTVLSSNVQGGIFKFQDYLAAFGINDALPTVIVAADNLETLSAKIREKRQPDLTTAKAAITEALKTSLRKT